MSNVMSSKERILRVLQHKEIDYVPLCFDGLCHGGVSFINEKYTDPFERADYYLELGVDTAIGLGFERISSENIDVAEWTESRPDEKVPVLVKEYRTPKGVLKQEVRKIDYESDRIHLFSDHNVPPGRSIRYLIESESDLEVFEALLKPPTERELEGVRKYAARARSFCDEKGIMMTGGLDGIGDPLMWLSGIENTLFAAIDNPKFLHRYIEILSSWNIACEKLLIEMGVDMIIRRGWYESGDFWSPSLYKEFLLNPLSREVQTAHEAGVYYAYIMNSGVTPMIDCLLKSGIDMLTNIEPDKDNLVEIKNKLAGKIAVCSGVNNYHIIELGSVDQVDLAVVHALQMLSKGGGFILSPSDSILDISENAQKNFYAMIESWKKYRDVF